MHHSGSICGTPGYVSPETYSYRHFMDKSDVYSLGVVRENGSEYGPEYGNMLCSLEIWLYIHLCDNYSCHISY